MGSQGNSSDYRPKKASTTHRPAISQRRKVVGEVRRKLLSDTRMRNRNSTAGPEISFEEKVTIQVEEMKKRQQ